MSGTRAAGLPVGLAPGHTTSRNKKGVTNMRTLAPAILPWSACATEETAALDHTSSPTNEGEGCGHVETCVALSDTTHAGATSISYRGRPFVWSPTATKQLGICFPTVWRRKAYRKGRTRIRRDLIGLSCSSSVLLQRLQFDFEGLRASPHRHPRQTIVMWARRMVKWATV